MTKEQRHIGVIGWIGISATIAYAAAMSWFVDGRWSDLQDLKLNELGDFLAGAFGPLAILWLVLGYFQQGIELRQNSDALKLQAEELRNSATQQSAMARSAEESLRLQLEVIKTEEAIRKESFKPKFIPQASRCIKSTSRSDGKESYILECDILNSGNRCSQIRTTSNNPQITTSSLKKIVENGEEFSIRCRFDLDAENIEGTMVSINCSDASGEHYSQPAIIIADINESKPYILAIENYRATT